MNSTDLQNATKVQPAWVSLLFIALGLVLLVGAYQAASQGQWPVFMPPQIDLFGLLFNAFGNTLGGYISALFLFGLGAGSIWLGAASLIRGLNA